jgi:hypothetical protein
MSQRWRWSFPGQGARWSKILYFWVSLEIDSGYAVFLNPQLTGPTHCGVDGEDEALDDRLENLAMTSTA